MSSRYGIFPSVSWWLRLPDEHRCHVAKVISSLHLECLSKVTITTPSLILNPTEWREILKNNHRTRISPFMFPFVVCLLLLSLIANCLEQYTNRLRGCVHWEGGQLLPCEKSIQRHPLTSSAGPLYILPNQRTYIVSKGSSTTCQSMQFVQISSSWQNISGSAHLFPSNSIQCFLQI